MSALIEPSFGFCGCHSGNRGQPTSMYQSSLTLHTQLRQPQVTKKPHKVVGGPPQRSGVGNSQSCELKKGFLPQK